MSTAHVSTFRGIMIPSISTPQLSNTSWYLEGKEVSGVCTMLTDVTLMVMFLAFWAIVCLLFWIVQSLDQDLEARCKDCEKALKEA